MKSDRLFIGIDSGTQGTKAVLFSENQKGIISQAYAEYGLMENEQGGREQDPETWIAACKQVIHTLLKQSNVSASSIKGIGVSGQQHGMVPLDEKNRVIRPAKLWCDTQTSAQCKELTQTLGGDKTLVEKIGNRMAEGFTAPKILWMKENEPANYEKLSTVLLPHDYLNFWLTGEKKTECGDASGTAYFDVKNRAWSREVLTAIDDSGKLSNCLPEVISSHEPCGTVRKELLEEFGLSEGTLVSSGGGDNMMAAIGTGNVTEGVVTASFGTSGTIYAYSDAPVIDPKGVLASFCSSTNGWLPLVCTMNVTVATELVRNILGLSLDEMNAHAANAAPGSQGIILLPYFNGERTPPLPNAGGSFHGLTSLNFTRENVCRSAMEGATMGLKYGMNILKERGISPKEIRLVGGGAKSQLWRKIAADIFNCPVVSPVAEEAGALGAALQAYWCWSNEKQDKMTMASITDAFVKMDPDTRCEPDREDAGFYETLFEQYLKINTTLTPLLQ
jgi:xylulokinase